MYGGGNFHLEIIVLHHSNQVRCLLKTLGARSYGYILDQVEKGMFCVIYYAPPPPIEDERGILDSLCPSVCK